MASSGRNRRLVSSLDGEVLERLSMKLNPRMLLKDYQSLAGRLKYTYEYIRNFDRERDPTLALLQHWWSTKRGKEKTVSVLIEHLSEMERDDCVDLLRPYEFYSSHEASELDERPVIAGAIDMSVNPYNPYFFARDEHQSRDNRYNQAKPNVKRDSYNGHQTFPDRREKENQQKNARMHGIGQVQREYQQNTSAPVTNKNQWPGSNQDLLNKKMPSTRLDYINKVPENQPSMMPSTSASFPNESCTSSVAGSMDSVQFEKYFMDFEKAAPKPVPSPQYQVNELPRFDRENNNTLPPMSPDEFYGARRDLRLHGLRGRPQPLDGSSLRSSESGMMRDFMGTPRYDWMFGDNRGYEHYTRTGVDTRFWQGNYTGYESATAAESHCMTAAADKVALVIGNQDYHHEKLRDLLYPEQDAADVAEALTNLNFKVISLVNLTLTEMRTAMLAFCCLLGKGVYGVVYYAGHGYEDNGENYLLPVDSDLKYKREDSLRTQEIVEAMQQCDTSLNLLIIDACRVSLPNKAGTKVPRIKRNARGNNIFAYSCCSQQESLEKSNCRNGMYCTHLLPRLRENRRVENVLFDVATDFARAHGLPQRPCLESDSMAEFRLTDPIQPEIMEEEYSERCRRWMEAKRHPEMFSVVAASLKISLDFYVRFCNILSIIVTTEKVNERAAVNEFHLTLETVSPLVCVPKVYNDKRDGNVICKQIFEVQNIQKHIKLENTVMVTIKAMFKENDKLCQYDKEIDLGWPLVSSITTLWDRWLLGDRCKMTTVFMHSGKNDVCDVTLTLSLYPHWVQEQECLRNYRR